MFMNKDLLILVGLWIITVIMLLLFIPKKKIREACLVFLFKLSITWFIGLIVVELRLIEYPVEFFRYATKTSFSFEYFIFPAICAIFNLNFPVDKGLLRKFLHYFSFCTAMSIIEALFEKYTNIIKYIHWSWYLTWITLFITFYISRQFYIWFFRLGESQQELSCSPSELEK